MFAVEDFKTVIEGRKCQLSDRSLQRSISKALYSNHLSKVCEQLNGDSCLYRNWKGLAISLIQPDMATIQRLSNCKNNEGYETLSTWLKALKVNEEGSFDELLQAMVECKVYAAANELLCYLEESVDDDDDEIPEDDSECMIGIKKVVGGNECESDQATTSVNESPPDEEIPEDNLEESVDDDDEIPEDDSECMIGIKEVVGGNECENDQATTSVNESPPDEEIPEDNKQPVARSISLRHRVINFFGKRSKSCPAGHPSVDVPQDEPLPKKPEKKKDGIFIVSLNEDSQTAPMMEILSFVQDLNPVKKGEWHVDTIHDQPGGPMATTWLQEKVETAVYVLICFSKKMNEVVLHSQQFSGQSECNLKFTLECLITAKLYLNMCCNPEGKFLPILLPGNDFSCIMQCFALFKTYSWPKERKSIEKYLLNLPERTPPPLGQRKPLVSKELP